MTFFTSVSPCFVKIFTSHFNLNILPFQKLNKVSNLLVFVPQSSYSSQYLTINCKGGKNNVINYNIFPLTPVRGLDCDFSNLSDNPTFDSALLKEEKDSSTKFTINKVNTQLLPPSCTSIHQWVKNKLQNRSQYNPSTITKTVPKKNQPTSHDIGRYQENRNDKDITFDKWKLLSKSPLTSPSLTTIGSRGVIDPQIKDACEVGGPPPPKDACIFEKKLASSERLGERLIITQKNQIDHTLNYVNVLLQPAFYCSDYYQNQKINPSTSYLGTSLVIIYSSNKLGVSSELQLSDNGDWGFIPKRSFKIIRPLLNCSRSTITKVCKHVKIPIYPDKSNESLQYSRNRIRKQILPIIKLFFNPQVEDSLFKLAELITKEQNLLSVILNNK